jgi:hypothetical protein
MEAVESRRGDVGGDANSCIGGHSEETGKIGNRDVAGKAMSGRGTVLSGLVSEQAARFIHDRSARRRLLLRGKCIFLHPLHL